MDLRTAVKSDALALREIGELLGDVAHPRGGERAAELLRAARAGKLETLGTRISLDVLGIETPAGRDSIARWITAHGRPGDGNSLAASWAEGRGRIAPPPPPPARAPVPKARLNGATVAAAAKPVRASSGKTFDPLTPMRVCGGVVEWH